MPSRSNTAERSSHAIAPLLLLLSRRRGNRGRNCCHLARRTPNRGEREDRDLASRNRPHHPQLPPRPDAAAGERRTASLLRRLHRHCYSTSSVTTATNRKQGMRMPLPSSAAVTTMAARSTPEEEEVHSLWSREKRRTTMEEDRRSSMVAVELAGCLVARECEGRRKGEKSEEGRRWFGCCPRNTHKILFIVGLVSILV
nr:hypothetical protein Iba_chr07dCG4270 [Ipomoea batatas]